MTTAVKQHCPYCADAAPDGGVHDCPTCGAPHHEDCWQENGGCAVFGCASAPRADARTGGAATHCARIGGGSAATALAFARRSDRRRGHPAPDRPRRRRRRRGADAARQQQDGSCSRRTFRSPPRPRANPRARVESTTAAQRRRRRRSSTSNTRPTSRATRATTTRRRSRAAPTGRIRRSRSRPGERYFVRP